jgi:hypothetical protein
VVGSGKLILDVGPPHPLTPSPPHPLPLTRAGEMGELC